MSELMKKLIIERSKLVENIEIIKNLATAAGTAVIAVLKGNGYGLGICEFANLLLENGITMLAVSEQHEAVTLRENGITADILLLSPMCNPAEASKAVELGIICAIGSEQSAMVLNLAAQEQNTRARAHVVFDTGFGRFGFLPDSVDTTVQILNKLDSADIEGTFTHLSDSFGDAKNSYRQFELFKRAVDKLETAGINAGMRHICNSCAFLRFDEMRLDAVRIGSAFLGRLPIANTHKLNRIADLQSRVCEIKSLPKGHNIGYANTYKTKRNTKIAVIPIGYKDGYGVQKVNDAFRFMDILRYAFHDIMALFKDNGIYVTIRGKRCRLLGRISMFNIIADVTDIDDAEVGDEVVLQCNPIMIDSGIEREYV